MYFQRVEAGMANEILGPRNGTLPERTGGEIRIGIRELKLNLSYYLRRVKWGTVVVITQYGRPIARLIPEGPPYASRLQSLLTTGVVAWSGRPLPPIDPLAQAQGPWTTAELLLKDRT